MPARIEPQLATSAAQPPDGAGWLHEIKLDGYRTLARIEPGAVRLITRGGLDWTRSLWRSAGGVRRPALQDRR